MFLGHVQGKDAAVHQFGDKGRGFADGAFAANVQLHFVDIVLKGLHVDVNIDADVRCLGLHLGELLIAVLATPLQPAVRIALEPEFAKGFAEKGTVSP